MNDPTPSLTTRSSPTRSRSAEEGLSPTQRLMAEHKSLSKSLSLKGLLTFTEPDGCVSSAEFYHNNHWIYHFLVHLAPHTLPHLAPLTPPSHPRPHTLTPSPSLPHTLSPSHPHTLTITHTHTSQDIIYVATIYNISHLITHCGEAYSVYLIACSFFLLMFSTRMFFDTYTSLFHASGILHTLNFIFYGLGAYVMTLNIAVVPVDSGGDYGTCKKVQDYNYSFAAAFLFTRLLLFVLYGLYGRSLFLEEEGADGTTHTSTTPHIATTAHTANQQLSDKKGQRLWELCKFRICPLVASCVFMLATYGGHSPVKIYSLVAAVDVMGDVCPQFLTNWKQLVPDRAHLEERLGLMFMLVLGESMLGFLVLRYNTSRPANTYSTLL
mmetsp:Transcript_27888/g.61755  ORF Transcript_27888/g.61755 Transcript_27888/m.61755 type:complete len:381 (+) Transcript_27888:76-1218(+)